MYDPVKHTDRANLSRPYNRQSKCQRISNQKLSLTNIQAPNTSHKKVPLPRNVFSPCHPPQRLEHPVSCPSQCNRRIAQHRGEARLLRELMQRICASAAPSKSLLGFAWECFLRGGFPWVAYEITSGWKRICWKLES